MIILYFVPITVLGLIAYLSMTWDKELSISGNIVLATMFLFFVIGFCGIIAVSIALALQGLFLIATNA